MSAATLQFARIIDPGFESGDGFGIEPAGSVNQPNRFFLIAQDLDRLFFTAVRVSYDHAVNEYRVFPRLAITLLYEGIVMLRRYVDQYLQGWKPSPHSTEVKVKMETNG
jgi:hypothetical protein